MFQRSMPRCWPVAAKHIATVLFTFAGSDDGGGITVGMARLTEQCGESERTIQRAQSFLRSSGFLVDEGSFRPRPGVTVPARRLVLQAILDARTAEDVALAAGKKRVGRGDNPDRGDIPDTGDISDARGDSSDTGRGDISDVRGDSTDTGGVTFLTERGVSSDTQTKDVTERKITESINQAPLRVGSEGAPNHDLFPVEQFSATDVRPAASAPKQTPGVPSAAQQETPQPPARRATAGIGAAAEEAAEIWNRVCSPALPAVSRVTTERRRKFAKCFSEELGHSLETWEAACRATVADDFCCGAGDRGWRATFDWLVRPGNCTRRLEAAQSPPTTTPRRQRQDSIALAEAFRNGGRAKPDRRLDAYNALAGNAPGTPFSMAEMFMSGGKRPPAHAGPTIDLDPEDWGQTS
jgi:hypothetical protein